MDNAGSLRPSNLTQLLEMEGQGAGQRARPMTLGGMHDHRGGFVDRNEIIVFVENVQRNLFRLWAFHRAIGDRAADLFTTLKAIGRFAMRPIHLYTPTVDRTTQAGPAKLWNFRRQHDVEPLADMERVDEELK